MMKMLLIFSSTVFFFRFSVNPRFFASSAGRAISRMRCTSTSAAKGFAIKYAAPRSNAFATISSRENALMMMVLLCSPASFILSRT